jgi:hypothetical protein
MMIEHMNIFKNIVKGRGIDEIGAFTINGDTKNGKFRFVKQYIG